MNEATATTTNATTQQAPPPAATEEIGGTVEERADAIFGPDVVDDGTDEAPDGDETAAAAPPATEKTPEQLAADRKARREKTLAELNAKTRASVDAKAGRHEAEQLRRQLEQERAERARLIDPSQLDPLKLLELGQRAGHSPKAIAEALQHAMGNPEMVAARAAQEAIDPKIAALEAKVAAADRTIQSFLRQQQESHEQAVEEAAHRTMVTFASENAATAPYAASFAKAYGPEEFAKIVAHVLPNVAGTGPQAVLDEVEDFLLQHHQTLSAWTPTAAAAPQRTQANHPRSLGTATQAPTHVTNTLAQQRSSVVDEDAALEDMPYEERASYLFRRR